jgi:hypothetical protein
VPTFPLDDTAFARGSLRVASYARPGKLFTASDDLVVSEVGILTRDALTCVVDAVVSVQSAASKRLLPGNDESG